MSEHTLSRDELLTSLKDYTALLETRKDILTQLFQISNEILLTLRNSARPDISRALKRREQKCRKYALLCSYKDRDTVLINAARTAAHIDDEVGQLARLVIALHEDSCVLGQKILVCQSECEVLLKTRIEATTQALCESKQRRKLVSAYGPACGGITPRFLDRQQ